MKKNLLSVLILALMVVNIVMTAIMMVSVIGTNKKTGELVTNIATVLNLELHDPGGSVSEPPLDQTATYAFGDRLMMQLKPSVNEDGKAGAQMVIFYMSLAMDMEHDDYKKLGTDEMLKSHEIDFKDAVAAVVQEYTEQEFRENTEQVKAEILAALQDFSQSTFIFRVSISDVIFQ